MAATPTRVERIGPYHVTGVLGRGGVGTVYAATDAEGRRVAIKVPDVKKDGVLRSEWLHREASMAVRLRHPRIVKLLTTGFIDGSRPYLVFERVEGTSLDERADFLTNDEIIRIGDQLLAALGYAHDAGVLHLDISPGNVLWTDAGEVMLTDFGLAAPQDPRGSGWRRALVAGTPGYLSPEQALGGGGVGPRSDLYGVGALLYRIMAGFPPHFGKDSTEVIRQTLHGEPLPLRPRSGISISAQACAFVETLIARDPERRPPSAQQARRRWLEAVKHPTPPSRVDPHMPTPAAPIPRPVSLVATEAMDPKEAPTVPGRSRIADLRTAEQALLPSATAPGEQEVPLHGRDALVDSVLELVFDSPKPIVLTGPAGVGKTAVLSEIARQCRGRDWACARVTARRGVPCAPFEPVGALALEMVAPDDPGPVWSSASRLAGWLERICEGNHRRGRDALVRGLLGAAVEADLGGARLDVFRIIELVRPPGRPLILLVDDAESVDDASLDVLDALAKAGVGVVMARRDAVEGAVPVPPFRIPSTSRLDLRPFDEAEEAVLRAAGAFGGDAPIRALAPVAGSPPEVVDQLVREGLLVPVRYPCARAELWVRLGSPDLEKRYGRPSAAVALVAAEWIARSCWDGSHGLQAKLASLAEDGGDRRRAAHAYAEAGRRAAAVDHPLASHHLGRALALGAEEPGAIDQPAVLVAAAQRHLDAGELDAAMATAERALPLDERPVLAARALRIRGKALSDRGRGDEAVALYEEAIALLGDDGDPVELALALASLGWQLGYAQGRNDEGIELGRRALMVAARIDAPAFRAQLCGRLGGNQLRAGDWDGQLATNLMDLGLSLRADDLRGVVRAHINLGVCYTNRGALQLARAHTEEACRLAERYGAWVAAQIAHNNLAMIACDDGRLDDADTHARKSIALAEQRGLRGLAETWSTVARLRHQAGDTPARDVALAAMEESARGAERALCARTQSLFQAPETAVESLSEALELGIGDPYERATTELALGHALQRLRGEGAERMAKAGASLVSLGADLALERHRWCA